MPDVEASSEAHAPNPILMERHRRGMVEPSTQRPGEVLFAEVLPSGTYPKIGRVWLYLVIDQFSGFAFGRLVVSRQPQLGILSALLNDRVEPFFQDQMLGLEIVTTSNQTFLHASEMMETTKSGCKVIEFLSLAGKAAIERFGNTALPQFFGRDRNDFPAIHKLQSDFDEWLTAYNAVAKEIIDAYLSASPVQ